MLQTLLLVAHEALPAHWVLKNSRDPMLVGNQLVVLIPSDEYLFEMLLLNLLLELDHVVWNY